MPAGFVTYADDYTYQITDEAESMVFVGRTTESWDKTSADIIATNPATGVKYKFSRIGKVAIPEHGVGLEVRNANGNVMFTTALRPMVAVLSVSINANGADISKTIPAGRSYAIAVFSQGIYSTAVNVQYFPPVGWEDGYYEFDEKARVRDVIISGNTVKTQITEGIINYNLQSVDVPGVLSAGTNFLQAMVIDVTGL